MLSVLRSCHSFNNRGSRRNFSAEHCDSIGDGLARVLGSYLLHELKRKGVENTGFLMRVRDARVLVDLRGGFRVQFGLVEQGLDALRREVGLHAGLSESFPSELQLLLRIAEYGPDEAWADSEVVRAVLRAFAGPATDGGSEVPARVIERGLEHSCSLIKNYYDAFRMRRAGVM